MPDPNGTATLAKATPRADLERWINRALSLWFGAGLLGFAMSLLWQGCRCFSPWLMLIPAIPVAGCVFTVLMFLVAQVLWPEGSNG